MSSAVLTLLDLACLAVYVDLAYVNQRKEHLYTPLLTYLPKPIQKRCQAKRPKEVSRNFYCVSDKIHLDNGFSFNTLLLAIQALSLALTFLTPLLPTLHPILASLRFYLHSLVHLTYILFCMHTYRRRRELCGYCLFTMLSGATQVCLVARVMPGRVPGWFVWAAVIVVVVSLWIRGAKRL